MTVVVREVAPVADRHFLARLHDVPHFQPRVHLHSHTVTRSATVSAQRSVVFARWRRCAPRRMQVSCKTVAGYTCTATHGESVKVKLPGLIDLL